jgi:serine/threonine-protein kinase
MMARLVTTAPAPPAPAPIQPGLEIAGKYRVEKVLGEGGMGVVVLARHIKLDDRVAIKFLLPSFAQRQDVAARFLREAKAARKIKSEHVTRVIDVDQLPDGAPYMVIEYLEGRDLSEVLKATGPLAIQDAVDYLIQGCEAIAEAHAQGIVHRDLKPANLFLAKRPDGSPIVKVLDFGISKTQESGADNLTRTAALLGSAYFMSPEAMTRPKTVDHRTDIYALGVTLYELLTRSYPFTGETLAVLHVNVCGTAAPTPIRSLRPEVPDTLAAVMERAYARDRDQRYPTVAAFVRALGPFASQPTFAIVERIARIGGMAAQSQPAAPAPAYVPTPEAAPVVAYAQPPRPPPPPPPNLNQIVPGPYHGPMSRRAAANFAQRATTGVNLSSTRPTVRGAPGKAGALVAAVAALLAIGAIALALMMQMSHRRETPASGTAPPSAAAPPSASAPVEAPAPVPTPTDVVAATSSAVPPAAPTASAARPPEGTSRTTPADHRTVPGNRQGPVGKAPPGVPSTTPADDGRLDLPPSVYAPPKSK